MKNIITDVVFQDMVLTHVESSLHHGVQIGRFAHRCIHTQGDKSAEKECNEDGQSHTDEHEECNR